MDLAQFSAQMPWQGHLLEGCLCLVIISQVTVETMACKPFMLSNDVMNHPFPHGLQIITFRLAAVQTTQHVTVGLPFSLAC